MQKRLSAIAKLKSSLDMEITTAVMEECFSILSRLDNTLGLSPTLAAITIRTLEDLSHVIANLKYQSTLEAIEVGLIENLSTALDMNERAEGALLSLVKSPKFKILARKKGKLEARKILMNMINSGAADMRNNTWLDNTLGGGENPEASSLLLHFSDATEIF